jgi:hypothetical protein
MTVVVGEGSTGSARGVGSGDSLGPTYLEDENLPEAKPLGLEWVKGVCEIENLEGQVSVRAQKSERTKGGEGERSLVCWSGTGDLMC